MSNHRLMRHAACLAKYPGEGSCAPAAMASCRSCVSPSAPGWLRVDRLIQTRPPHPQTPQQTLPVWPLRYAVPAATNRRLVEASCGAVAVDDIRTGLRGTEGYFMIAQFGSACFSSATAALVIRRDGAVEECGKLCAQVAVAPAGDANGERIKA